ncbi:8-amino-7-oxononanoate synthase [Reichenbachiella sp. 5M10]|uniref:aminotransferase class I/II-fold pyridoxal phosphate-dependent enzyme n=1 Tax=Reichenbachiella sp. 5M10 TaxID=1889772 RepID=UPI000C14A663|nr:8-amino-7-oxononanoate synthase [Reichenbachiella sp. 5M10]PIB34786.1 8-amino-7-oxononanoate synthase [Reichenbachiella sp. 5M10]
MKLDFIKKLEERKTKDNLRSLTTTPTTHIDFSSNDYLGLSRSRELFDRINSYSYEGITTLNGSTGSRLLAGNSDVVMQLESKLARLFDGEAALLFNSGYVANLALISTLPQRQDTIIYDSLSHVCIKEGAQLSHAKSYSFRHNDPNDLETKLKKAQGQKYVIIESIYSMDGDMARFDDLITICQRYEAKLLVDEAHGTGLYGKQGNGKVCSLNLQDQFLARIYTFGKAMGVHGACIIGSQALIEYLINFARPFIYTTALPIHSLYSIEAAFDYLSEQPAMQEQIQAKTHYFNQYFDQQIGSNPECSKTTSSTPIQPLIIPGNTRVKALSHQLQREGLDVRAILSPTVPEGSERLRICLHLHNTQADIKNLIDTLSSQL